MARQPKTTTTPKKKTNKLPKYYLPIVLPTNASVSHDHTKSCRGQSRHGHQSRQTRGKSESTQRHDAKCSLSTSSNPPDAGSWRVLLYKHGRIPGHPSRARGDTRPELRRLERRPGNGQRETSRPERGRTPWALSVRGLWLLKPEPVGNTMIPLQLLNG